MVRALAIALGALLSGCVTDHDALAKRPGSGGAGGGSSGAAGAGGGGASGAGGSGGSLVEAGTDGGVEPPGDNVLTLTHGVVDEATVAFCFAKNGVIEGSPIPAGGLAWGESLVLASIAGIDLAEDDVQPFVIGADAALLSGLDCASAIAMANSVPDSGADAGSDAGSDASSDGAVDAAPIDPAIRARGLPLIPKATLSGGYSYLLVAAGCIGAPSRTSSLQESVCGIGYTPTAPTLAPVLVQLSRTTKPDKLGLQVVHASVATETIDARSLPPDGSSLSPIFLVYGVVHGAIAPRPPNLSYPLALYGQPIGAATFEIASSTQSLSLPTSWQAVLSAGGLSSVENGSTYAVVLVGPRISIGKNAWWNGPLVTIVPTDPSP